MIDRMQSIYFSGSQCEVLFGEKVLTEALSIDGNLEVAKIPIFGYNSYHYDTIATGRVFASGTLVINYVFDGYLFSLMNKAKDEETDVSGDNGIEDSTSGGQNAYNDGGNNKDKAILKGLFIPEGKLIPKNDEIIKLKKDYWDIGTVDEKKKISPEFITTPFDIKIRDFKTGHLKSNNQYEEKIIKGVSLNRYSTTRQATSQGVVEIYSFVAKTII